MRSARWTLWGILGAVSLLVGPLTGCSRDGGGSPLTGPAGIVVYLTDAPAGFDNVWVTLDDFSVHKSGGKWFSVPLTTSNADSNQDGEDDIIANPDGSVTVDLLALQGVESLFASGVIDSGHYTQLRLRVVSASAVQGGTIIPLKVPSGAHTGLKIVGAFSVDPCETASVLLDFDAAASIVLRGGSGEPPNLTPVITSSIQHTPFEPAAPEGVSARGGTAEVTVDWDPVDCANSYNIYWDTIPGVTKGSGNLIVGAIAPYVHTGLTNGTTYYYVVTGVNGIGPGAEGAESTEVSAMPVAVPGGLSATGGTGEVTVDWAAASGATSYDLYWSTTPGVTKGTGSLISGAAAPYLHAGLTNGTTYYYVVAARNDVGGGAESAVSAEVSAMPVAIPGGVWASAGTSEVTCNWAAALGATSYDLYWSTTPGVTKGTGNLISGATAPYLHAGRTNGTTYYYVVTARNGVGGGAESGESAEAFATPVAAPTGLSASPGDSEVVLGWSSTPGATSYHIYWATSPGVTKATGTKIPGATSPHVHTGLTNGVDYFYVVTAANAVGGGAESVESAEASATPRFEVIGVRDDSFGPRIVFHDSAAGGDRDDEGNAMIIDSSGRILIAGSSDPDPSSSSWSDPNDMAIWRFHPDGSLDTSFNGQGWVTHDNATGADRADVGQAIAIDATDRIVVAGWSDPDTDTSYSSDGMDMVIWRFDDDGSIDTTFNGQGWVVHNDAAGGDDYDSAEAIAVDGSGRIVAAGWSEGTSSYDTVVWRYNDDGSLDTTFNGQGWVVHDDGASEWGRALALDGSGRIVVAGTAFDGYRLGIVRLNDDGSYDTTFNGQGWVSDISGSGWAVGIDGLDRIVAGGRVGSGSAVDMAAWRYNDDGTLDTTFNGQGWIYHNDAAGADGWDEARSLAFDASGRILVAGRSEGGRDGASVNRDMAVWRLNADGTLDTTFDSRGWAFYDRAEGSFGDDEGNAVALTSTGRIIVAGYSRGGSTFHDVAIWGYVGDGHLDWEFPAAPGRGWVTHHDSAGGGGGDEGEDIAVDAAGKILMAGWSEGPGTDQDAAIWRHHEDGTLDTSFGGQGWVVHHDAAGGNGDDAAMGIALDTAGRILIAGESDASGIGMDVAIWRYEPDGTLDTTFNGQGWVTHHDAAGGNGSDSGSAIALDGAGKIVVAGQSGGASTGLDLAIWRFDPDGSLDTTFNGQGWVTHHDAAGGDDYDYGNDLVLDASGRIVVAGSSLGLPSSGGGTAWDMVVWRYETDGTLDTTFNGQGWVTHHNASGSGGNDEGNAVTMDSADRILVTGKSSGELALWRFSDDGSLDTTFNGQGWVANIDGSPYDIAVDGDGRILVTGAVYTGMRVWRFLPDGNLDLSFNSQGWLTHGNAAGAHSGDRGLGMTLDSLGRVLVAGRGYRVYKTSPLVYSADAVVWRVR